MGGPAAAVAEPEHDPLLVAALECYGSALRAVGRSALEACPATGRELDESLSALAAKLSCDVKADATRAAEDEAERHLASWGAQTAEHLKGKADEVKELLMMLARTAESVGE